MNNISINKKVEKILRELLLKDGYQLNTQRESGEGGPDIVAFQNDKMIFIEVAGFQLYSSNRSREFFEIFFRAISQLNNNANKIAIAFPSAVKQGLPLRARQYRIAWKRISDAFPELEIWLVDIKNNKYEKTTWIEWLV